MSIFSIAPHPQGWTRATRLQNLFTSIVYYGENFEIAYALVDTKQNNDLPSFSMIKHLNQRGVKAVQARSGDLIVI